ncbi:MAG: hypothetical protein IT428_06660 [Planctomycetaceae bacterium]|nr:hypothetical protein [Planctomycetaceae bacterium]
MTSDGFDGSRRKRSPLRDEEIDRLLTRFFQQEMPASLDNAALQRKSRSPVVRRPGRSWRQSATAASMAAALVMATWRISAPERPQGISGEGAGVAQGEGADRRFAFPHAAPGALADQFEMDPEHAPVERRAGDRTVNVMSEDPESTPRLESDFPELTIEIVPIPKKATKPDDSARKTGKPSPETQPPREGR